MTLTGPIIFAVGAAIRVYHRIRREWRAMCAMQASEMEG